MESPDNVVPLHPMVITCRPGLGSIKPLLYNAWIYNVLPKGLPNLVKLCTLHPLSYNQGHNTLDRPSYIFSYIHLFTALK